jgi:hypothetical protein
MSVIPFPTKQTDIPGEARDFADRVEEGEFGRIDMAIVVTSGGSLQSHYWGDMDPVKIIGMLETAKHNLVRKLLA